MQGATYDSAKRHYSSVLLPLIKGGKLLSAAVGRAVQKFPNEYVARVDSGDLKQSELEEKIRALQRQIDAKAATQFRIKQAENALPIESRGEFSASNRALADSIDTLERTRDKMIEKLKKLTDFHYSSVTIFSEIDGLKKKIATGTKLATSQWNGSVFVPPTTSQLTWATEINDLWAKRDVKTTIKVLKEDTVNGPIYFYEVYVDGEYSEEQSKNFTALLLKEFTKEYGEGLLQGVHFAGEFVLINDIYRLVYGEDWLSNEQASRLEAAAWLAVSLLPYSKLAQISKELKAGNKLLKGISLTSDELKILNNAGFFKNGAKQVEKEVVKKVSGSAFGEMSPSDAKRYNQYWDDVFKGLDSNTRVKLNQWGEYRPSADLYNKYTGVYDNPKYYDQTNGKIHWPENDGFVNKNLETYSPGKKLDRYGEPDGSFLGNVGDPYPNRALPPHSENAKYYSYEVIQEVEVTTGAIAPWFDQPGGGTQIVKYHSNGSMYTIQELIEEGFIVQIRK